MCVCVLEVKVACVCVCVLFCSHIAQLKVSVSCVVSNTRTPAH